MVDKTPVKIKVLFIAGQPHLDNLIDLVVNLLIPLGIEVAKDVAETYEEAEQKIKDSIKGKPYDLIFSDILVPPKKIAEPEIERIEKREDGWTAHHYKTPIKVDDMIVHTDGLLKLCKQLELITPIILCRHTRSGTSTSTIARFIRHKYEMTFGFYFYPFSQRSTKELRRILPELVLR
jgi:hypothetical protein